MKPTLGLIALTLIVALFWNSAQSGPMAAPASTSQSMAGTWTTGAVGTLGDVVYGPGEHVINLTFEGLYDPALWVVILDYNTLTIESGATVRFLNHPTRAPVVIRAVGDIVIHGEINLDGARGHSSEEFYGPAVPGPGGFRGGIGLGIGMTSPTDGHGPGGGYGAIDVNRLAGGSHSSLGNYNGPVASPGPTYGSGFVAPLVGGSGATGAYIGGGGAGGGAILIGSDTSNLLNGLISAEGGSSGYTNGGSHRAAGSGGSIRIVSPVISWSGAGYRLLTRGGEGNSSVGVGWTRVETVGTPIGGLVPAIPGAAHAQQLGEFLPVTLPTVTVVSWWDDGQSAWIPMGQDPQGVIDDGSAVDVRLPDSGLRTLRIEARDVPLGAPLHVRTTDTQGRAVIDSSHTVGEVAGSTQGISWTDVQVDFTTGISTIQARAELP